MPSTASHQSSVSTEDLTYVTVEPPTPLFVMYGVLPGSRQPPNPTHPTPLHFTFPFCQFSESRMQLDVPELITIIAVIIIIIITIKEPSYPAYTLPITCAMMSP